MSETVHRHHHRSRNPSNLRSAVMRHVVGFGFLFVYLFVVWYWSNPEDGTSSNMTVIFFLVKCFLAYGLGYFLYTPVRRAWMDSKS